MSHSILKETVTNCLIPFIMTGDPNLEVTTEVIQLLEEEGVAAIELGVPFSDPLADGPAIQKAGERALDQGVTLHDVLSVARTSREQGSQVPLILFSYVNPLLQYGLPSLMIDAKEAGFSGLIVPDLPLEESEELRKEANKQGLAFIPLVAPTSEQRMEKIINQADGFVYCVSSVGTTGVRSHFSDEVIPFLQSVKEKSSVPTAVGFGISTAEHVQTFRQYADAVVVGSALVKQIDHVRDLLLDEEERKQGLQQIRAFVRELKSE